MAGGDAVAQKEIDLSYNDAGESASIQCILDGNVVLTSDYTYDSLGRLTGLAYHQGNTVLDSFSWTYSGSDAGVTSGDVVSGLETAVGGSWRPGQNILPVYQTSGITADTFNDLSLVDNLITSSTSSLDGTVQYSYDSQGQLTGAAYSGGQPSESYSYDANGNRTNAGYVTGADNELLSDGTYTYTYDAEGNRTAKFVDVNNDGVLDSGDTNVTEYTWDVRNRLSEVKTFATAGGSPTAVVDYLYDAENRWIGENIDSTGDGQIDHETRFVYDGDQIVLQFDKDVSGATALGAADESHRYLWGPAVDQLLADEQVTNPQAPGNVLFALTDNQNTVRDLAQFNPQTATTSIVVHREFNSYGQLVSQTNPATGNAAAVDCLFGFTGFAWDQGSGTWRSQTRPYDPTTGRWIQVDPTGFNGGDTNLERYCGNSPVNATDPSGLTPNQHDAVTIEWLVRQIEQVENAHPKENAYEILCRVAALMQDGAIQWSYIYTTKAGWMDIPHFMEAASFAYGIPVPLVKLGGWWVELSQLLHGEVWPEDRGVGSSAFTYEDLPSNSQGAAFGAALRHKAGEVSLSFLIAEYFTGLGATAPTNAPNWKEMPKTEEDYEESWQEEHNPMNPKYKNPMGVDFGPTPGG
jgi:RHS repeat-associated protein